MQKKEKVRFAGLERLGATDNNPFSETELLEIIGDSQKLAVIMQTRRMEFFSILFTKLSTSPEFHHNALEIINNLKKKRNEQG